MLCQQRDMQVSKNISVWQYIGVSSNVIRLISVVCITVKRKWISSVRSSVKCGGQKKSTSICVQEKIIITLTLDSTMPVQSPLTANIKIQPLQSCASASEKNTCNKQACMLTRTDLPTPNTEMATHTHTHTPKLWFSSYFMQTVSAHVHSLEDNKCITRSNIFRKLKTY